MNVQPGTGARVVTFCLGLAVAFLAARGVGSAVGPAADEPAPMAHAGDAGHAEDGGHGEGGHADHEAEDVGLPGGLTVSQAGYTLRVVSQPRPGGDRPLRFAVVGPDGHPVTAYDEVHDQRLHLIKVRRDGSGYRHVHPTMAADGTWSARLPLAAGSNRVFADFTPSGGPALVLGADVEQPGHYEPVAAPAVTRTARVDGYRITLTGDLVPGEASPLTVRVTRGGEPVTDLQPYLGAYGHLVALREGDLAYLHVHPEESGPGPEIPFLAEVPSTGRYRLFLDFRHGDVVRTAEFVVSTDSTTGGRSDHGEH